MVRNRERTLLWRLKEGKERSDVSNNSQKEMMDWKQDKRECTGEKTMNGYASRLEFKTENKH